MSDQPGDSNGSDKTSSASADGTKAGRSWLGKRASLRSPNEAIQPEAPPPPPEPKKRKKRRESSLSGTISGVISFLVVAGLIAAGAVMYGVRQFDAPGPLAADKIVMITPGMGTGEIAELLEREGVVSEAALLRGAVLAGVDKPQTGKYQFQAGEYQFKANMSVRQVLGALVGGKVIQHSLTIPEGLTSEQIVQRLRENDVLIGDVRETPKEGTLAPNTYKFSRGTTRDAILVQMRDQQTKAVQEIWAKRTPDLSLKSTGELLTLASIVEKETGKSDERPRVAAVFLNRLQKRMRLQSDPTIVYGLVGGKGTLGRGILRSEVMQPTAYNTYVIDGLPPGPIANPGRAALEAVANPARTRDLYFVADGSGGHAFAESLDEHNRNVLRWRQIERDAKDKAAPEGPLPTPGFQTPGVQPPSAGQPQRRGALDGPTFGALPLRLDQRDAAHATFAGGPDLARAAAGVGRSAARAAVEPAGVWSGALGPMAFATHPSAADAPAARAVATLAPSRAGSEPQAGSSADARPEQAGVSTVGSTFVYKPSLEGVGVIGVTTTAGYLDIDEDPEAPGAPATMQTFPVSPARQADLKARAAHYGLPSTAGAVAALPVIDPPASAPPASAAARGRTIDASEGTSLDPLKASGWDLNSPKTIPAFRPLPRS